MYRNVSNCVFPGFADQLSDLQDAFATRFWKDMSLASQHAGWNLKAVAQALLNKVSQEKAGEIQGPCRGPCCCCWLAANCLNAGCRCVATAACVKSPLQSLPNTQPIELGQGVLSSFNLLYSPESSTSSNKDLDKGSGQTKTSLAQPATRLCWSEVGSIRSVFVSSSHSWTCDRSACIFWRLPCPDSEAARLDKTNAQGGTALLKPGMMFTESVATQAGRAIHLAEHGKKAPVISEKQPSVRGRPSHYAGNGSRGICGG